MPNKITPRKVSTPGSYPATPTSASKRPKETSSSQSVSKKKKKKSRVGRPGVTVRKGSVRAGNYRSKYSAEDLKRAYVMVKEKGWSAAAAARECKVPRATLADKLSGRHKTGIIGRPTVLSRLEEDILVDMCVLLGLYNYPVTKRHLRDSVAKF